MGYTLLTGSTGLLGGFLLRDLLLRNERVAVVVRPSRQAAPEQRVDSLLHHWESEWGRNLPRPVVLSGDMTQPLLGLGATERAWLRRHCEAVLHSAASLIFYEKRGEPWRTNVEGVKNVLNLCRDAGIRRLEHVSSAYVCGLRSGRVYESELDVGQEFGNDYEKSKVAAEQLVRSDPYLDGYTIYRPSIIVGDSQTGYTPTFHGFYSPLRVLDALLGPTALEDALQVDFLRLLGLKGDECKNFIPVDWVSEAITSLRSRARPQKRTYMLTSDHPVTVTRMRESFEAAIREHRAEVLTGNGSPREDHKARSSVQSEAASTERFEQLYVEHFAVYRSYWRDDPDFDRSNTCDLLPDLPPPAVTDEMLQKLARYALERNFGYPPPKYDAPPFAARNWIRRRGTAYAGNGALPSSSPIGITVTGPGGGSWTMQSGNETGFRYSEGCGDAPTEARLTNGTFHDLVDARTTLDAAIAQGKIVIYGDPAGLLGLRSLVKLTSNPDGS